jgi:hypothetical protein
VRIIAVDWSGAKHGAKKKIWAAEFCDGTPVEELISGKDRESMREYLIAAARESDRVIVGLDFAFSFPSWFVETQAISVQGLWAKVSSQGETWLDQCDPPFWGRKGKQRCDLAGKSHYRCTEERLEKIAGISPKSVFQINGGGAVGTGSIRGMAILHQLSSQFRIWPFDDPGWPRIIEIWPRVLTGRVTKSDRQARKKFVSEKYRGIPLRWQEQAEESEDAFDAVVSACVMEENKDVLSQLETAADPIIRLEGLIWCPPPLASAGSSPSPPPAAPPLAPPAPEPAV